MNEDSSRTLDAPGEGEEPSRVVDVTYLARQLGRYQIVRPLAQGGMGVVFAARLVGSHGVERLVAIKTLRPITSSCDRTALLREARLTASLHHPNVVATIDLGEVDDVPYVVMELVDGVPLSRLLASTGAMGVIAPELSAWIVMQAALGLHAAHELADAGGRRLELVHRDISPQNILLSMQGEVKIADFGIAKFVGPEESTATGLIKGKFAYMSPEQATDAVLDRRSDIFALGVVLWEALTGSRLFASDSPARTIMRVLEHAPRPPHQVRPDVGADLSAIALRCLAKHRHDRFESAAVVAEALRNALRTRLSLIDQSDLAAVITARFGEERRRLIAELVSLAATGNTTTQSSAGPDASQLAAMSVNATTPPQRWSRRSIGLAASLLALAVSGLVGWRVNHAVRAPAVAAAATPLPSAPPWASSATLAPPSPAPEAPAAPATPTGLRSAVPPVASGSSPPTPVARNGGARRSPAPRAADPLRSPSPNEPSSPRPAASVGQPVDSLR